LPPLALAALALALAVGLALPGSGEAASVSEVKKLTAPAPGSLDDFGFSVAVSGDTAVVGAVSEDAGATDAGAAYVFQRDVGGTGNWGQVKKLTASDAQSSDNFGYSVALSGDIAVVGADTEGAGGDAAGAAYVFSRNRGGDNNWGQVKKLTASDPEAYDVFGVSVAVSGDIAVVGAKWEDAGGELAGAAYVFSRNQGGANNWGQVKKLTGAAAFDNFGVSVAVSGDIAVVGAWLEDLWGNSDAGAAYVFSRNQGGTDNWGQVKKLDAGEYDANDYFGVSVAVSGDIAVVGAHGEDVGGSSVGAAYVFSRNQGGANNWGHVKKLTASDAQANDEFGISVALSGDIAVVGADREDALGWVSNAGAAYVFQRYAGGADNWGQVQKLTASDAQADDWFGYSVAVSGEIAVVGAYGEDPGGANEAGSAYVFRSYANKLTAYDADGSEYFGDSVAVSGDVAVAGAYMEYVAGYSGAGAAYVFSRNQGGANNWGQVKKLSEADPATNDWFGYSVAVSGDIAVVGSPGQWQAAYIFSRNQGGTDKWGQVKKLTASDGEGGDRFGWSVAVSGDIAVVGAYQEDAGGSDAGAAYVFSRNQGGADNWGQVKKLTASDGEAGDNFGISVALSGDIAVVGAHQEDAGGSNAGAAYVFSRNQGGANNWGQVKKVTASDPQASDQLGSSVAVSGDIALAGAYGEDAGGSDAGAAYVFSRNTGGADNWGQAEKLTAHDAQADDEFGFSVAASGNTAVVGADAEDAGASQLFDAGAAYVFPLPQVGPGAVGGIADLPDLVPGGGQPSAAPPEGSGWSGGTYAALAAGVAAAALALAGAGWYASRRWRKA
jgi:hypothetical protein